MFAFNEKFFLTQGMGDLKNVPFLSFCTDQELGQANTNLLWHTS
jgi:hypothetical protein